MLRPIDAIFRHPVKKFTVIYQNGTLWQLPQLNFDGQSHQYKRLYKGSREQIFVAKNQRLDPTDTLLCSQLATIELPATVVGATVEEFEQWWAKKSYDYREAVAHSKAVQQQAQRLLATQQIAPLSVNSSANTSTATLVANPSLPTNTSTSPVSAVPATSGDIFEDMLADLTKGLV